MFSKVYRSSDDKITSYDDEGEEEEVLDLKQLSQEIEAMHTDLDLLHEILHISVAHCPGEVQQSCESEQWVQLYGSKQPDIRKLQLNTRHLEQQMNELKTCGKIAKVRIEGLEKRQIAQKKALFELQGKYDWIHSKYLQMEQNYGKCLQRYRRSRTVYATWTDVHQSADELKLLYKRLLDQMYDRPTYCAQKKHVLREINLANSRCVGAIQVSLIRAKELGHQLDVFSAACPLWSEQQHQQILKTITKRKQSRENPDDYTKVAHVTINFESEDAFDWDLQSRKQKLKHGSVSEIEIVKPPALSWYGRMQKLMATNRKPTSLFHYHKK